MKTIGLYIATALAEKERLCCPFFGFNIEIVPEGGNV
jgi:hypothetical protein